MKKSTICFTSILPFVIIATMSTCREYKVNRQINEKKQQIIIESYDNKKIEKRELTDEEEQEILDGIKQKIKIK